MTPDRLKAVQDVFLAVTEAADGERTAVLDRLCGGDDELRAEVRSLLTHDSGDPDLVLSKSLVPGIDGKDGVPIAGLRAGAMIGSYTVVRLLGSGGMGAVYLAEQERPRRTVALKLIRPGMLTPALQKRMELEAEFLGRLHHPGIAHIYEAGRIDDALGQSTYFAMEFIDGPPLTEYAERHKLDTRARLELMLKICDAVNHAHHKGIIHRDLKPSNIVVDPTGQPKVLDFGVARAADGPTLHTGTGQLIGTLPYMSPEQVSGTAIDVDTRSDVYALGVVFYQLLSGRLPHQFDSTSIPEAARIIREIDPPSLGALRKELRGDIETIAARAMDKDRSRRYQSADALGAEIKRYLAGEPIEAKRDSAIYVFRKQLRRYRTLAGAVCLLIIGLSVFSVYAWIEAGRRGALAEDAEAARDDARGLATIADAARAKAEQQSAVLTQQDYFNRIGFAQAAFAGGDVDRLRRLLEGCPESMRGWEWEYLSRASDVSQAALHGRDHDLSFITGSWSPARFITNRVAQPIGVFDSKTRQKLRTIQTPEVTAGAAISPDGAVVAARYGTRVGAWSAETGAQLFEVDVGKQGPVVSFTSDGAQIMIAVPPDQVQVRSARDGSLERSFTAITYINVVVSSPDGTMIAVCAETGKVGIWNAPDGTLIRALPDHPTGVRSVAFDPQVQRIVTGCKDGYVRVWSVTGDGPALSAGHVHSNKVTAVAFSPKGDVIASGSTDTLIRLSDAATCEASRTLPGHADTVMGLWYSGETIVSISRDQTVRWWSTKPSNEELSREQGGSIYGVAFLGDGRHFLTGGRPPEVRVWNASNLGPVRALSASRAILTDLELSSDGAEVFTSDWEGGVAAWNVATGKQVRAFQGHTKLATDVSLCEKRGWLLSCGEDGPVHVWDVRTGDLVRTLEGHAGGSTCAAALADGSLIFTGGKDNQVRVWSGEDGRAVGVLGSHSEYVISVMISPDGSQVVSTGEDGVVYAWPVRGGPAREFVGHRGPVYSGAFSPDGTRLVTGGFDNCVRLWDFASGTELLTLRGHIGSVHALAFSPDGNRILSCSDGGRLRMWSARRQ